MKWASKGPLCVLTGPSAEEHYRQNLLHNILGWSTSCAVSRRNLSLAAGGKNLMWHKARGSAACSVRHDGTIPCKNLGKTHPLAFQIIHRLLGPGLTRPCPSYSECSKFLQDLCDAEIILQSNQFDTINLLIFKMNFHNHRFTAWFRVSLRTLIIRDSQIVQFIDCCSRIGFINYYTGAHWLPWSKDSLTDILMARYMYSLSVVPGQKGDTPPLWNYTYIISFEAEGKVKLM